MGNGVPKYLALKTVLKEAALKGEIRPGEQISTEAQLAERYNVSRQTVRQAINELVHENVLYRRQGKGTFVAESFLNRKADTVSHNIIAVITTYISDYIFPSIVRGIESRLSEAKYSMLLMSTNNNLEKEAQAIESVLERPVDGVILEPTKSSFWNPNVRRYLDLISKQIPIVMMHSSYAELSSPCVRMDDEKGGYMAVEHLHQLGHERIGAMFKVDDAQGRSRLRGFVRAHKELGIPLRQEWLSFYTTEDRAVMTGKYVASLLNADGSIRPTALVCYNDEVAADIYSYLTVAHMAVPDDLSLISFDDSAWAQAQQCTALQHPKYDMGFQAADHILTMIEASRQVGVNPVTDYIFDPQLVVRSSTQSPYKYV